MGREVGMGVDGDGMWGSTIYNPLPVMGHLPEAREDFQLHLRRRLKAAQAAPHARWRRAQRHLWCGHDVPHASCSDQRLPPPPTNAQHVTDLSGKETIVRVTGE